MENNQAFLKPRGKNTPNADLVKQHDMTAKGQLPGSKLVYIRSRLLNSNKQSEYNLIFYLPDRNPSPPPIEVLESDEELELLHVDQIEGTAFSKKWTLNILLNLAKVRCLSIYLFGEVQDC